MRPYQLLPLMLNSSTPNNAPAIVATGISLGIFSILKR
ncbi:hypothetical protein EV11_0787 [Prochlorococcus sp. SS52]|nr:hypothetical protein EV04_0950 [Prochlorococcus marinus str. LG]KGG22329.1 hypothetical protein EV08_0146 [Prochlorococcus marinus str. SS2]KGG36609.1 hypothetical protein EV11_0787 [Prochlorococcus sp. SS52]